jgi:predicted metal-dependent hydrolase
MNKFQILTSDGSKIELILVVNKKSSKVSIKYLPNQNIFKIISPRLVNHSVVHKIISQNSQWIQDQLKKSNFKAIILQPKGPISIAGRYNLEVILGSNFSFKTVKKLNSEGGKMLFTNVLIPYQNYQPSKQEGDLLVKKIVKDIKAVNLLPLTDFLIKKSNLLNLKLGLPARITNSTTRWGSCSHDGRIMISSWTFLLPKEQLLYVIHHELAHLKYKNHKPEFWQYLEQIYPGAKHLSKIVRSTPCGLPQVVNLF